MIGHLNNIQLINSTKILVKNVEDSLGYYKFIYIYINIIIFNDLYLSLKHKNKYNKKVIYEFEIILYL